jgi:transposase
MTNHTHHWFPYFYYIEIPVVRTFKTFNNPDTRKWLSVKFPKRLALWTNDRNAWGSLTPHFYTRLHFLRQTLRNKTRAKIKTCESCDSVLIECPRCGHVCEEDNLSWILVCPSCGHTVFPGHPTTQELQQWKVDTFKSKKEWRNWKCSGNLST